MYLYIIFFQICPLVEDIEKEVQMPFSLQGWIADHREEIDRNGKLAIFDCVIQQFQVQLNLPM